MTNGKTIGASSKKTMLKGLIITHRGAEDIAARETEEIIGAKAEAHKMCAVFETADMLDFCKLSYMSQSAARILLLFDRFEVTKDQEETVKRIEAHLKSIELAPWIKEGTRYKVECRREGEHEYTSQVIAEELGERIGTKIRTELGFEPSADLKKPELIIYVLIVDTSLYIGIDLSGFDLSKRDYKIMSHMPSVKGTIAYSLLRIADYEQKDKLVDLSSFSGVVTIEAAIFASGRSVNYFRKREFHFQRFAPFAGTDFDGFFQKLDDKALEELKGSIVCAARENRNISASKSNSKIAGVNKLIDFSRQDIEWLDTKFDKGSLSLLASNAPRLSKTNEADMTKYYKELFYQADYVLKKKGRVALLCNSIELIKTLAEAKGFKCSHERSIWQGDEELKIVLFERADI